MNEIWKDITGYEGLYQVSNLGNVRSLDREINYNNQHRIGKVLKIHEDNGYKRVNLCKLGEEKKIFCTSFGSSIIYL